MLPLQKHRMKAIKNELLDSETIREGGKKEHYINWRSSKRKTGF